ncbi:unnamed protein product [Brassica oleracea]
MELFDGKRRARDQNGVPRGQYLTVYVGHEKMQRFVIPTKYLEKSIHAKVIPRPTKEAEFFLLRLNNTLCSSQS